MTTEQVLALAPGPELDKVVHQTALGRVGRPRPYSTDSTAAVALVEQLPIFACRMSVNDEGFDEKKPYLGGIVQWHPGVKLFVLMTSIRCATLPLALCKAALVYSVRPKEQRVIAASAGVPSLGTPTDRPHLDPMPPRTMAPKLPEMPQPPKQE